MMRMGRKRKNLEDKSSVLMLRLDNKTIFLLCDKFDIEYDRNALIIEDETKSLLIEEIRGILKNIVN